MLPVTCNPDIFEKIANAFIDSYSNKTSNCFILFNNKTQDVKLVTDFTPDDVDSLVCRVISIEKVSYFGRRTMTAEFVPCDKHRYYDAISIIEID